MAGKNNFMLRVGFGDKKIPAGSRGELRMENGEWRMED
jgi:hypothetical protein